jgi:hypothetical protein
MMDIVTITMPSLMDLFISNLRFSQQVVIKPGRASEQTKLDLAQLDPSNTKLFPEVEALLVASSRLNKMGDQDQSTHIFPTQPEADSNQLVTILDAGSKPGVGRHLSVVVPSRRKKIR